MICDIKVQLESAPRILGGFVLLGKIGHGVPDAFISLEIDTVSKQTKTDISLKLSWFQI